MKELPPTETDRMVFALVDGVVNALPVESCSVQRGWSEDADMWITEVQPRNPAAAEFSVGFDGSDLLTVTAGRTWFEIFPVTASRTEGIDSLREILEAVVAGRIEESPGRGGWAANIGTTSGGEKVGAVQWPWSRKPRPVHKYEAYSSRQYPAT